jgi:hypothetical protein
MKLNKELILHSQKKHRFLETETPFTGDEHVFKHSEAFIVSRDALIRDFLNAETQYDRYVVLQRAISWLEAKEEIAHYREQEIKSLRSQIDGYDLSEYAE